MTEPDPDFWPHTLLRLSARESLTSDDSAEAMRRIMSGETTPSQVAGFLMALRTKGETAAEVDGLARTMLAFAHPITSSAPTVDVVGTGGDRSGTFNISTVAAIVTAAAGAPVAKHGNRAASSHCGSADVLEALGVAIDLDPTGVERCLREAGIAFLFAPVFHPSMAHAGLVRRELRVPTVFNFLGPLTNPAKPAAQAVGCSDARMLPLMAEVLARRGTRALVFRGEDGLDELSTTGPSIVFDVRGGEVSQLRLDPTELGLAPGTVDQLQGGDAGESARIVRSILAGEPGPKRDVALLNAGAALQVAGRADTLGEGLVLAAETIDSGAATALLERWVAVSQNR